MAVTLLVSILPQPSSTPFIGRSIPRFTIEDQFTHRWTSNDFRGRPVVFVISDRSGYDYMRNWTPTLVERYEKVVRFIPVADVRGVPGFLKSYIRGRFRDEFSYSVLMDWEGIMATAFKIVEGVPNFIVADDKAIIRYAIAGTGTRKQTDLLAKQLDVILGN